MDPDKTNNRSLRHHREAGPLEKGEGILEEAVEIGWIRLEYCDRAQAGSQIIRCMNGNDLDGASFAFTKAMFTQGHLSEPEGLKPVISPRSLS